MADFFYNVIGGRWKRLIDMLDGSHAERIVSVPPANLLTDFDGVGPNTRLRVDVGQTGFFSGREFRMFREITDDTPFVIRATVPVDVILFNLNVALVAGEVRMETVVGGTPSGAFTVPVPTFNRNNMTDAPLYAKQVVLEEGGAHAGGTLLDVLQAKTSDNSNFASNVGVSNGDERGILPGTYYFRVSILTATCRGVVQARWEERPLGV